MMPGRKLAVALLSSSLSVAAVAAAGQTAPAPVASAARQEGDPILGGYGPYRANNHLLHYNLHVRVDVAKKFISGMNAIQFRMLEDGTRIQLDLVPTFTIDGIVLETAHGAPTPLKYNRVGGRSIYIDFPRTLKKANVYTVDF